MRTAIGTFVALVAISIIWVVFLRPGSREVIAPQVEVPAASSQSGTTSAATSAADVAQSATPLPLSAPVVKPSTETSRLTKPLAQLQPTAKNYREEVRKNPHGTPLSLMKFSMEVADRMEAAKDSPLESAKLFKELESCIRTKPESSVESAQAFCLLTASRLADRHPGVLSERYSTLEKSVDKRILELTRALQ